MRPSWRRASTQPSPNPERRLRQSGCRLSARALRRRPPGVFEFAVPWVVGEVHLAVPGPDWTEATVPSRRTTPEADVSGGYVGHDRPPHEHRRGRSGGSAVQSWPKAGCVAGRRVPLGRTIPNIGHARGDARLGPYAHLGVSLLVDLPHNDEIARPASPERQVLEDACLRLRDDGLQPVATIRHLRNVRTVGKRFDVPGQGRSVAGSGAEHHSGRMAYDEATFGVGTLLAADSTDVRDALATRLDDLHDDTGCEALVALARLGDQRAREQVDRQQVSDRLLFALEGRSGHCAPRAAQARPANMAALDVGGRWRLRLSATEARLRPSVAVTVHNTPRPGRWRRRPPRRSTFDTDSALGAPWPLWRLG